MKNKAGKKGTALVSNRNGVEKSYAAWIADLKHRYRATQIKAAVAVNSALIEFYWNLGKDIAEKFAEEARYGSRFSRRLASTCGQNSRTTLDFHRATSGIVRIFTACIPPYRFCNKLLQNLPQANGVHQNCNRLLQNPIARKLWMKRLSNNLLEI